MATDRLYELGPCNFSAKEIYILVFCITNYTDNDIAEQQLMEISASLRIRVHNAEVRPDHLETSSS